MKELGPLIPKWSNLLSSDKYSSIYSIFCAQFSLVFGTFLYKIWKHVFTENVSSRKISEYMIWELNFNQNPAKIVDVCLRYPPFRIFWKKIWSWEWSHWKADEICYILEGAQIFETFFDQVFFQTLYFNVIFRHIIVAP